MKYPIDCENSAEESYLFWLSRFLKHKITTLSNRHLKDEDRLANILQALTFVKSIDELKKYIKEVRNIGVTGIHLYYIPLEKLYKYLKRFGANSLKEIDEEFLSQFLIWASASLSDATKKNYRIALLSFFKFLDKQNSDRYSFGIELKNWGGLGGKSGEKLPSYMKPRGD